MQYIEKARGLALAIVVSGPAIVGAIIGPLLNAHVEAQGWRSAYEVVAIATAIAGVVTFLLIPASSGPARQAERPKRRASEDYPLIFRAPAFWFLVSAMLLCNLPQTILLVQLKMMLLDNGITGEGAAVMLSAAPLGTLAGRFLAGVALDRYNPYRVAFITLALPSLGLFFVASPYDAPILITIAVFFIGFAYGAEGDLVNVLNIQSKRTIYGTVTGIGRVTVSGSPAAVVTKLPAATGSIAAASPQQRIE